LYPRGRRATLAAILRTILKDRPSTQKEIAEKVGVSRRYVTELLQPLIEKGAVFRTYAVDMTKLRRHFPELLEELGRHIHEDLEAHLRNVRPYFERMIDLTESQVELAIQAVERDPDLARKIVRMDEEVNRLDEEIRLYVRTLPTFQPSEEAGKTAALLLEISHCIERVGDYSCNIAEVADRIGTLSDLECWDDLKRAAERARSMISTAYDAFLSLSKDRVKEAADRVYRLEEDVHDLIVKVCDEAIREAEESPSRSRHLFAVSRVTKDIERIADKAVDIVDYTRELIEGRPRDLTPEQEVRETVPADTA